MIKPQRPGAIILCLIILIILCFVIVSCGGSSPPDGYLATDANSAYFIQFTMNGNQLTGSIQGIEMTNDIPPQTKSFRSPFTGTQNGSSVTITISAFGFSSSVTGTMNGNTLILDVPQQDGHLQNETFTGSSLQQYNQAVDALQQKVSQQDQQYNNSQATATALQTTQTAQRDEQQAVSYANSQLSNALNSLKYDESGLTSFSETTTLNGYANDWKVMQKDYATEQNNAQAGCGTNSNNYNQVLADANQVSADENQILADDRQLSADKNQYDLDVSTVQNDVKAVKDDWVQLQQAVTNNMTNIPAAAYTLSDVNNALQSAQNSEKTAQAVWQSAQSSVAQYDHEANALKQKADALPANMHCN